jgi:hypothetical protein
VVYRVVSVHDKRIVAEKLSGDDRDLVWGQRPYIDKTSLVAEWSELVTPGNPYEHYIGILTNKVAG